MSSTIDICASAVGSLCGLATSLTLCLESKAWTCTSTAKNLSISAISIALFALVNGLQHKFPKSVVPWLNGCVTLSPTIMFSLAEVVHCKQKKQLNASEKVYQAVHIVPMIMLPLAIFYLSGNIKLHDKICSTLHRNRGGQISGLGNTTAVPYNSADAADRAMRYLQNRFDSKRLRLSGQHAGGLYH